MLTELKSLQNYNKSQMEYILRKCLDFLWITPILWKQALGEYHRRIKLWSKGFPSYNLIKKTTPRSAVTYITNELLWTP